MNVGKVLCFIAIAASFSLKAQAAATLPADLTLNAPLGGDPVETGATIHYQFVVDNIGEASATSVGLIFFSPLEGSFVDISSNCEGGELPNTKISCDLDVVAANTPVTIDFFWKAPEVETTLELDVQVFGAGESLLDTDNNNLFISTVVTLAPEVPVDDGGNGDGDDNGAVDDGGNAAEAASSGGCSMGSGGVMPSLPALGISAAFVGLCRRRLRKGPGKLR